MGIERRLDNRLWFPIFDEMIVCLNNELFKMWSAFFISLKLTEISNISIIWLLLQ